MKGVGFVLYVCSVRIPMPAATLSKKPQPLLGSLLSMTTSLSSLSLATLYRHTGEATSEAKSVKAVILKCVQVQVLRVSCS